MSYPRTPHSFGKHHVLPTPANSATTPAVPSFYGTKGDLIPKDSDEYARLRHRAVANNVAKLDERPDVWRKSALTDTEKYYLWNSQNGCCANTACKKRLDMHTMTIEHVVPKSKAPKLMWDIRDMTILCHSCNSAKGDRHATFHYAPASNVETAAKRWAEGGKK